MEHEKITVRMLCDIGVYKDLTRHRLASYSIESTRYCNYSKDKFDNQLSFIEPVFYTDSWIKPQNGFENMSDEEFKSYTWYGCMKLTEEAYNKLSSKGCTPDEMRMILPHSTAAEIVMTANIREWMHILSLRCSSMTHQAVQQLLIPLLLKFKVDMPEIFENIEYNKDFPVGKYAELNVM